MRNAFVNTILEACSVRDDIFVLTGDAGLGVFDQFRNDFPDRYRNMGVAEQNTVSFAAGLAMTGFKVFVYNIAPFVLYRCYEQVRNDICYQNLPVTLVGTGSGITYAPMGMSHYSVEDVGVARTLPNLAVISPADPVEARLAALYALDSNSPAYIRLAKRGEPTLHQQDDFDITSPQVLREGTGVAVLFHGSISVEAVSAWEMLRDSGMAPRIISIPMLQPLDIESLLPLLGNISAVITVEEHYAECGLGGILALFRNSCAAEWSLMSLGVPYSFIHQVRGGSGLRQDFGVSAAGIVAAVKTLQSGATL